MLISTFDRFFLQLSVEGESYHKTCFKCSHGGCLLTTSNYAALQGTLYCKIHFAQLFKEKGCYNHLLKSASKKEMIVSTEEAPVAATIETEAPEEAPVVAMVPELTPVVAEPLAA
jgi:cysteine and glycine-rich protein